MARWAQGMKEEAVDPAREGERAGCRSEFLIFLFLVLSFSLEGISLNKVQIKVIPGVIGCAI